MGIGHPDEEHPYSQLTRSCRSFGHRHFSPPRLLTNLRSSGRRSGSLNPWLRYALTLASYPRNRPPELVLHRSCHHNLGRPRRGLSALVGRCNRRKFCGRPYELSDTRRLFLEKGLASFGTSCGLFLDSMSESRRPLKCSPISVHCGTADAAPEVLWDKILI
ncbi:hypothetical protein BGY98DRAFT_966154, partial [Russula aff. rugulosa BPL654]